MNKPEGFLKRGILAELTIKWHEAIAQQVQLNTSINSARDENGKAKLTLGNAALFASQAKDAAHLTTPPAKGYLAAYAAAQAVG